MPSLKWTNRLVATCLAAAVAPVQGIAQTTGPIELGPPEAEVGVPFTQVVSIRELPDGRLLVADRGERRLVLIHRDGDVTVVGQRGDGPGEYLDVGWLYPLHGDSTLFTDSFNGRWHLLVGGRIVETLGLGDPLVRAIGQRVRGTGTGGRVVGVQGWSRTGPSTNVTMADTLLVLRADRATHRLDTVARIRGRGREGFQRLPPSGGRPQSLVAANPLAAEDQVLLFPDGWIALARTEPYRVDWVAPDGRWIRGAPLPAPSVPVNQAEQQAAMARFGLPREIEPSVLRGWPGNVPPFLPSDVVPALLNAPDGSLVIARTPRAGAQHRRYDIVDRTGRLTAWLLLADNEALVGFGQRSVYIVARDEWDLGTLRRHPWP